jgi:hypothetical protein
MTPGPPWGTRLALWWAASYTATAPAQDAADRRAEIAADVADESSAARGAGPLSLRIAGRVLRGAGADLLWRLSVERAPGRARWHLDHPATVMGTLAVLLAPVIVLGDRLRDAGGRAGRALLLVHSVEVLLSAAILSVATVALLRRLVVRRDDAQGARRTPLEFIRRLAGLLVCVSWAAAALWRFVPGPLGRVSAAAWAAFGLSVVVWGTVAVFGRVIRWRQSRTS